jgi:hypothetical protein
MSEDCLSTGKKGACERRNNPDEERPSEPKPEPPSRTEGVIELD